MAYTKVNWQDLPSTTTPINATNLGKMDDGIANLDTNKQDTLVSGTNIKTINNTSILGSGNINIDIQDIYSSTETKTNKIWTDEKPIYRKVFTGTINETGTWITIPNSIITNKQYVTNIQGMFAGYLPIPAYVSSNYSIAAQYTNNGLQLYSLGYSNGSAVIIVEYTKTTD